MTIDPGTASTAAAAPRPSSVTLAHCWTFVAVAAFAVLGLQLVDIAIAESANDDFLHASGCFITLMSALAHGMWVTLDCRRRGTEVGCWRWGAILFGPIALALYLLRTYGARGLAYIVLMIGIYAVVTLPPILLMLLQLYYAEA